jgi:adenylylsulfate kinase-like enzyme
MKNAIIFWCTGLSGVGKTTLALSAQKHLENIGLSVLVVDGDRVRESYKEKLGFGKADIEKNNMRIVAICEVERKIYDVLIVPVISPIDNIRKITRKKLEPLFSLIYISCDLNSLKRRDPKGLYAKADKGDIQGLIGYSANNPYDIPEDADFSLDTSHSVSPETSKKAFLGFVKKKIIAAGILPE